MSNVGEGKDGWSRRKMLGAMLVAPALAASPVASLAQVPRGPVRVALSDISYGFRFVRKGDVVSYWVRAVNMRQNENVPVSVVFGTATIGASASDLAVDPQSIVYKRNLVLARSQGFSNRGRFKTSVKKRKLTKGQTLHCQLLFASGAQASNVWTFKV